MSNDDVMEATAALKGMLGIGSGQQSPAQGDRIKDVKDKSRNNAGPNQNMNKEVKNSSKKKKTKKKKTPVSSSGLSNKEQVNVSNANKELQGSRKNRVKKIASDDHNSPPNSRTSKGKKKENANFAWSAFQSPPDASSLPLPAFSSTDIFSKPVNSCKEDELEQEETVENISLPLNAVIKSAEQFENEIISAAEAKAEVTSNKSKGRTDVDKSRGDVKNGRKEYESQTGVNLAAMASSASNKKIDNSAVQEGSSPSLLDGSKPKVEVTDNIQSTSQQIYNDGFLRTQHHQQQFTQQHQIITIQVQVPPVLMAGRQMMVHTPAGYPIPVVVPENVQPGMVIPVNVPAPINFHPHHPQMGGHPQQLMQQHHIQHPQQSTLPPSLMSQSQYRSNITQQQHHPALYLNSHTPHYNGSSQTASLHLKATPKTNASEKKK